MTETGPISNNDKGAIGSNDVLCGRGGATNNHVGNRRFRSIVAEYQREYLAARKKEKAVIARSIVAAIKQKGGRFLKRDEQSNVWVEVTEQKAQSKASQALREGLDVRRKTIRPEKMTRPESDSSDESPRKRAKLVVGHVANFPSMESLPAETIPDLNEESVFLCLPAPVCNNVEEV